MMRPVYLAVTIAIFLLTLPAGVSAIDTALAVYVGAHPDDIDIGMSGSLYKYDLNRHPILWIVVTDGGADRREYGLESDAARAWVKDDGTDSKNWVAPNGQVFNRGFYSNDLSRKRCGLNGSYQHVFLDNSSMIQEFDWRSRVDARVGSGVVEKVQMSYPDPSNSSQSYLYPDGGLHNGTMKNVYSEKLAEGLAETIYQTIISGNYSKDMILIHSHAPVHIARNSHEHPDHEMTGNAVLAAIDLLVVNYGIKSVDATWYTIYNPIRPGLGYVQTKENIVNYKNSKSNLVKTDWETAYNVQIGRKFYWIEYPNDPGDFEYVVREDYPAKQSQWNLFTSRNYV
ncbi:PIG-L family deacetylase [Methanoculleus chikugoensis]|uniref:GlcNAc-PI de-N-acetylase n=1 Tax=Methanoculleus chikugoensis TaxID=118126 RepID=A0ABM7H5C3_9EURY|nr:PIG-L family deacetylase [Methanoculleus chikugoensis]BBL67877.1 hypothetical protein MchiMG62_10580 [Methanoculleus chikugoensis]